MGTIVEIMNDDSSVSTLKEFVEKNDIELTEEFTLENLLFFEGNEKRVFARYSLADRQENSKATVDLIKNYTLIKVPSENIRVEISQSPNNEIFKAEDYVSFVANQLIKIIQNKSYIPINLNEQRGSFNSKTFRISNNVSVWIWSRALGEILNVTPFVVELNSTVGDNGGSFSLKLPFFTAQYDKKNGWSIPESETAQYSFNNKINTVSRKSFLKQEANLKNTDTTEKRHLNFFHHFISPNDLVFLQYETLEMEKQTRNFDEKGNLTSAEDMIVSSASLPNMVFDMIGLVDASEETSDSASSDISVQINGRDCMKLIIEDGCYFFPLDFLTKNGGFIDASGERDGIAMKRLVTGELMFFNAYVDRSIEFSLNFVLNQLRNIEVVPTSLFQYYDEKNSRFVIKESKSGLENQKDISVVENPYKSKDNFEELPAEGIWQIIDIAIDESVRKRRIVDSSITSDSGSLLNFFQKVCQKPFVEFWGDTYGDRYVFIARKPPFTQSSINDYIENKLIIDIEEADIESTNLYFREDNIFSWYRLVPQGSFLGDQQMAFVYLPSVFLGEYAKIWGSKPLQIVTNYVSFEQFQSSETKINLNFLEEQALNDLAFIIEINANNPFKRSGSITLSKGDRRIKKGMFIRLKGTGEIAHVDNVSHSFNVGIESNNRSTVLNLSNVMVEEYLNGDINYFNIVDLKKDRRTGIPQSKDFKVNLDVFNFFIKKLQFR